MALVGTALGIVGSFFLAILASRVHSPHPVIYFSARGLISLFRFCGRFFAEAMEEVQPGPQEALNAMGARRVDVVFCSVVPAALPSFVNSSLYSLEKATRASVILGLVGAGGIGIELKVAMDLFHYNQAATAILAIFALVIGVEQVSGAVRRQLI